MVLGRTTSLTQWGQLSFVVGDSKAQEQEATTAKGPLFWGHDKCVQGRRAVLGAGLLASLTPKARIQRAFDL